MKVFVLLLLLGLQRCAEDCGQKFCENCERILGRSGHAHDCGNLNVCQVHNSIESFFSKCGCTGTPAAPVAPVATVGSLIGLLLMILVLVVTGWVWTCWTLKKKKKETQQNCQKQESDSEEERFCLNQIYQMTKAQQVVGTAIEQPLDSQEESGQSVNGLGGKDNKGYCGVNRVENIYTSSEGSSHSSLQEQQRVNRVEDRESRVRHMYYVLEKPGGDDYEESGINLEENTAVECETPVPLNEL